MIRRATFVAFIGLALFAFAATAYAYDETGKVADSSDCAFCHAINTVSVEATGVARQRLHGGYTTTSRSCAGCHTVHGANPVSDVLLPGETLTQTCEICHDGTGGKGVYGTLAAKGLTVASAHRTEMTSIVPGGNDATGGSEERYFSGLNNTLTCGDCHSPHGSRLVDPFTTDRMRTATDTAGFFSSELLRRKVNDATTTPVYGSDWCGGCHQGRVSQLHTVINHPVEASGTAGFTYENLQVVAGVDTTTTQAGTLGHNNFGYVMPYPRSAGQKGHSPICQQCHEDVRNVGDTHSGEIAPSEVFRVTSADGADPGDNPRFQVFPHESTNVGLLLETDDDLCTNCHSAAQLP